MSLGLRVEDRLDGQNNYSARNERIQSIFEEAEVWGIMVNTTQNPVAVPVDPVQLAEFNKKDVKEKRLILEGVSSATYIDILRIKCKLSHIVHVQKGTRTSHLPPSPSLR